MSLKKILSILLASFILINSSFFSIKINAKDIPENFEKKNLFAIILEKELWKNNILLEKIKKYWKQAWNRLENTNVSIFLVDKNESEKNIYEKLEKLYFDWIYENSVESHLSWFFMIWDLKLPKVKIEEWIIEEKSIFPYTDFENKFFIFNEKTKIFERQTEISEPKAEIWHWILRNKKWKNNIKFYLDYFDKLEKYENWELQKSTNIFFTDTEKEKKSVNETLITQYKKKKNYNFQIANKKYSHHFFDEISKSFYEDSWLADIEKNGLGKKNIKKLDKKDLQKVDSKEIKNSKKTFPNYWKTVWDYNKNAKKIDKAISNWVKIKKDLKNMSLWNDMILSFQIEKLLPHYTEAVKWYVQKTNSLILDSWEKINKTDTIPKLITKRDYEALIFIKNINDLLDKKLEKNIRKNWQTKIKTPKKKVRDCLWFLWTKNNPNDNLFSKQVALYRDDEIPAKTKTSEIKEKLQTFTICPKPEKFKPSFKFKKKKPKNYTIDTLVIHKEPSEKFIKNVIEKWPWVMGFPVNWKNMLSFRGKNWWVQILNLPNLFNAGSDVKIYLNSYVKYFQRKQKSDWVKAIPDDYFDIEIEKIEKKFNYLSDWTKLDLQEKRKLVFSEAVLKTDWYTETWEEKNYWIFYLRNNSKNSEKIDIIDFNKFGKQIEKQEWKNNKKEEENKEKKEKKNEEKEKPLDKEIEEKCGPHTWVQIFKWPSAITCRIWEVMKQENQTCWDWSSEEWKEIFENLDFAKENLNTENNHKKEEKNYWNTQNKSENFSEKNAQNTTFWEKKNENNFISKEKKSEKNWEKNLSKIDFFPKKIVSIKWKEEIILFELKWENWNKINSIEEITIIPEKWIKIKNKDINPEKTWIQLIYFWETKEIKIIWENYWNFQLFLNTEKFGSQNINIQIQKEIFFNFKLKGKKDVWANFKIIDFEIETIWKEWEHIDYNWLVYFREDNEFKSVLESKALHLKDWIWKNIIVSNSDISSFTISSPWIKTKKINLKLRNKAKNSSKKILKNKNKKSEISKKDIIKSNFITWYFIWENFANLEKWIVFDFLEKGNAVSIASNLWWNQWFFQTEVSKNWEFKSVDWIINWIERNSNYKFFSFDEKKWKIIWEWEIKTNEIKIEKIDKEIEIKNENIIKFQNKTIAVFYENNFSIFDWRITILTNEKLELIWTFWEKELFRVKIKWKAVNFSKEFLEVWEKKYIKWEQKLENNKKKWTERNIFWNWFKNKEKVILKYTSGQNFWESLRDENWIFSVLIWDPTVKFRLKKIRGQYSQEIWKEFFRGNSDVLKIKKIDFNSDWKDDILVLFKDWFVKLFEWRWHSFLNRWDLLFFENEILNIEIQKNDIITISKNWKISYFKNKKWRFLKINVALDIWAKFITDTKVDDLNFDWKKDLIIANSKSQILVFYWNENWFSKEAQLIYRENNIENNDNLKFWLDKRKRPTEILIVQKNLKLIENKSLKKWYSSTCLNCSSKKKSEKSETEKKEEMIEKYDKDFLDETLSWEWAENSVKIPSGSNDEQNIERTIESVSSSVNEAVDTITNMTCMWWGCIPSPINMAFLVPWKINIPNPLDQTSLLKWELPWMPIVWVWTSPPYICTLTQCYWNSLFRFYLSPTLTWWVWLAFCLWSQSSSTWSDDTAKCFAVALPMGQMCEEWEDWEEILNLDEWIWKIENWTTTFTQSLWPIASNQKPNWWVWISMEWFQIKVFEENNKTVSAFASSFLTKWADKQIEEVSNSLLTIPTIKIVIPDVVSGFRSTKATLQSFKNPLKDSWKEWKENTKKQIEKEETKNDTKWGSLSKAYNNATTNDSWELNDTWKFLNESWEKAKEIWTLFGWTAKTVETSYDKIFEEIEKIKFIKLKRKKVILNIPWINPSKIEKTIAKFEKFGKDIEKLSKKTSKQWENILDCGIETSGNKNDCKEWTLASVNVEQIQQKIQKNIEILKSYQELPSQIAMYRYWLTWYLWQIIEIIDCFVDLYWVWLKRNTTIVEKYYEVYLTIIETIKLIKDLSLLLEDFKDTCEPCRANTYLWNFDLMSLVMSLIPEPPIMEFPNWPDIKLDLSDIQLWIEIEIPEVDFNLKEIIFDLNLDNPNLNNLEFMVDWIPELPEIPQLPQLPKIPAVNIPKLPDLPPPPKLPEFPWFISSIIDIVKIILKLYCIIFEMWLSVYGEDEIKQVIEWLTNRWSSTMLPIDYLKLQIPNVKVPWVEEIEIKTHINLDFQIEWLYETLNKVAEEFNEIETNLKKKARESSSEIENNLNHPTNTINNWIEWKRSKIEKNTNKLINFHKIENDKILEELENQKAKLMAYKLEMEKSAENILIENNLEKIKNITFKKEENNKKSELFNTEKNRILWLENEKKVKKKSKKQEAIELKKAQNQWLYFINRKWKAVKFINYKWEAWKIVRPIEINIRQASVYAIWKSLFYKEKSQFYFQKNIKIEVKDFDEIKIEEKSVNLFESYLEENTSFLNWKDDEKIDSYLIEIKEYINWFDENRKNNTKSLYYLLEKKWAKNQEIKAKLRNKKWNKLIIKTFETSQIEIPATQNYLFSKIKAIKNGKIWTSSVKKLVFWEEYKKAKIIKQSRIEKFLVPILVDFEINLWKKEEWNVFYFDLNWDWIFEISWTKPIIPARNKIEKFKAKAKIVNLRKWKTTIIKLEIETFVPKIFLNKNDKKNISWNIKPKINKYPVWLLLENKDWTFKKSWTTFFTNKNWEFKIPKNILERVKRMYDEDNNTIAILDIINKKIKPWKWFEMIFNSSEKEFSNIQIKKWNESYFKFFTKIKDVKIEKISEKSEEKISEKIENNKIFIKDLNENDKIILNNFQDWVLISNWENIFVKIWTNWEIKILDENIKIQIIKSAQSSFAFEVIKNWNKIFEFYIWVDLEKL